MSNQTREFINTGEKISAEEKATEVVASATLLFEEMEKVKVGKNSNLLNELKKPNSKLADIFIGLDDDNLEDLVKKIREELNTGEFDADNWADEISGIDYASGELKLALDTYKKTGEIVTKDEIIKKAEKDISSITEEVTNNPDAGEEDCEEALNSEKESSDLLSQVSAEIPKIKPTGANDEKFADVENKKENIIILPDNEDLQGKLQAKLEEYRERLNNKMKDIEDKSDEEVFKLTSHGYYKFIVLKTLIKESSINISELAVQLKIKDGYFDEVIFKSACEVINDYCTSGGANLYGGTGLSSNLLANDGQKEKELKAIVEEKKPESEDNHSDAELGESKNKAKKIDTDDKENAVIFEDNSIVANVKQETQSRIFIEKVYHELNIPSVDLEKLNGFSTLSVGQKLLVLERFKQITLGRIEAEAKEEFEQRKATFTGKKEKFWQWKHEGHDTAEHMKTVAKNVWLGLKNLGGYQVEKGKKIKVSEIEKGGLAVHGELLQNIVNGMLDENGQVSATALDANMVAGADGDYELKVNYLPEALRDSFVDPENQEILDNFNQAAQEFSQVPDFWNNENADKGDKKAYRKLKREYEKARTAVLQAMAEEGLDKIDADTGNEKLDSELNPLISREQAMQRMSNIDSQVYMEQFWNANPDAEKEISEIKNKGVWKRTAGKMMGMRGLQMGAGYFWRPALAGIGVAGSASLIGIALYAGARRSLSAGKKELLDKNKKAQRQGDSILDTQRQEIIDKGDYGKLLSEFEESKKAIFKILLKADNGGNKFFDEIRNSIAKESDPLKQMDAIDNYQIKNTKELDNLLALAETTDLGSAEKLELENYVKKVNELRALAVSEDYEQLFDKGKRKQALVEKGDKVDARYLNESIDFCLEEIKSVYGELDGLDDEAQESKKDRLQELSTTLAFMIQEFHDYKKEQGINYGDEQESLGAQHQLYLNIARAESFLSMNDIINNEELEANLNKHLKGEIKELGLVDGEMLEYQTKGLEELKDKQKRDKFFARASFLTKKTMYGIASAGAFVGLGATIREAFGEEIARAVRKVSEPVSTSVKDFGKDALALLDNNTPPEIKQNIADAISQVKDYAVEIGVFTEDVVPKVANKVNGSDTGQRDSDSGTQNTSQEATEPQAVTESRVRAIPVPVDAVNNAVNIPDVKPEILAGANFSTPDEVRLAPQQIRETNMTGEGSSLGELEKARPVPSRAVEVPRTDSVVETSKFVDKRIFENMPEKAVITAKNNSIELAIKNQFKVNSKDWGFEGVVSDKQALEKWAGNEAHKAAYNKFVGKSEAGNWEIRLNTLARDNVAYHLEGSADNPEIVRYLKNQEGKWIRWEDHELGDIKTFKEIQKYEDLVKVVEEQSQAQRVRISEQIAKAEKILDIDVNDSNNLFTGNLVPESTSVIEPVAETSPESLQAAQSRVAAELNDNKFKDFISQDQDKADAQEMMGRPVEQLLNASYETNNSLEKTHLDAMRRYLLEARATIGMTHRTPPETAESFLSRYEQYKMNGEKKLGLSGNELAPENVVVPRFEYVGVDSPESLIANAEHPVVFDQGEQKLGFFDSRSGKVVNIKTPDNIGLVIDDNSPNNISIVRGDKSYAGELKVDSSGNVLFNNGVSDESYRPLADVIREVSEAPGFNSLDFQNNNLSSEDMKGYINALNKQDASFFTGWNKGKLFYNFEDWKSGKLIILEPSSQVDNIEIDLDKKNFSFKNPDNSIELYPWDTTGEFSIEKLKSKILAKLSAKASQTNLAQK